MSKNEKRNSEGYFDLTAYEAIKGISKDEERFHKLLDVIFHLCDLSGFHIEERIVIRDKKTGKIWR